MALMDAELGLRERKKQRTRMQIADTARQLFAHRGFEAVSVAEVARAADVSEATVFNYFPTKEDLVYQGLTEFEEQLLGAVRDRSLGESVLDAFGRFVSQSRGLLAAEDADAQQRLLDVSRMIASSPTLLARERQILAGYTDSLAALLREETGAGADDVRPWLVANTLIGLHAALIDYVRRRLVADSVDVRRLRRDVHQQAARALELLRQGLGEYGVTPGS
jgi:AcrR family transcriptional regulator